MEDKIVNNLIYGYPFFFPIWKAPIDQQKTLQASFEDGTMSSLPGFHRLNEDQMEQAVRMRSTSSQFTRQAINPS